MRIPSLIFGTVLACGLAFAGHNEAVVYTAGNLTGITPRANAVLDLSQDVAMKLRIGRTDVSVPFASITKTDEAADSTIVPAPGQKGAKPFELLTVEFNSVQGEPRTMTLQMSKLAASHVLATIHKHVPAETKTAALQTRASSPAAGDAAASAPAASAPAASTTAESAPAASAPAASDAGTAPATSTADNTVKTDKKAKPVKAAKAPKPDKQDKQAKADKKDKSDKVAKKDKKDKKNEDNPEVAANAADAKPVAKKDDWWGDSYWKTHRNLPKWEQQGGVAAAQ